MDDPNTNTNSETKLPCHRFAAAGNCNGCQNEHHPNLSPALVGMVAPQQYRVPNEVGVACLACMEKLRECDKQSHDPTDERDPCSECRHFGGEKAQCKIAPNTSYNDAVYRQMLVRRDYEYKLVPFMTARSKGPMPAERVKDGWQGQSTEALMAKGDFLPLGVRECPRAFIVPARESTQRTKSKRYLAKEAQKFSHSSSLPSLSQPWQGYQQSLPPSPFGPAQPAQPAMWPIQPPPPPPPPAYPVAGHAAPMFWAPQPGVWTPQYPYGYQMPYAMQVPPLLQQPSPFAYPAPPPPPSFPTNPSYGNSFAQAPPLPSRPVSSPVNQQSSRRSASSVDNQPSSKKKRFVGLDGIFSKDVLEEEVVPGVMDENDRSMKREQ